MNTSPRTLSSSSFGPFNRFRLFEFMGRFGEIGWLVADAETPCPVTGLPDIVVQAETREEAIARALSRVPAEELS
jgi:hypothetical protein